MLNTRAISKSIIIVGQTLGTNFYKTFGIYIYKLDENLKVKN